MPSVELMNRKQKAVLWPAVGVDTYGQFTFDDPVQLDPAYFTGVRWLTKRTEAVDAQGNKVSLDATAVVDRDIDIGSLMWLGDIDDLYAGLTSYGDSEVMEVKTFGKTPDLKNRKQRRTVGLMRYRNLPPGFDDVLVTSSDTMIVTGSGAFVVA